MTTSRRHAPRPIVVEVKPDNLNNKNTPPSVLSPSTPPTPSKEFAPKSRVRFASSTTNTFSRPLTSTEAWSLYHFENHARSCPQCYDPLEIYRRGERLCEAGHWLAQDVACHVYHKEGEIYSCKKDDDSKLVRVEIPHGYSQLRQLLKGMDRSLRTSRQRTAPIISYDRSYPVSDRKNDVKVAEQVIIEPAKSETRRPHIHHRHSVHGKPTIRYSTVVVPPEDDDDDDVEEVTGKSAPAPAPASAPIPARRGTRYELDKERKREKYRIEIREPSDRKERRKSTYYYD